MHRFRIGSTLVALALGASTALADDAAAPIVHSVFFELKHAPGSAEEAAFFARLDALASIPGVDDFERVREVSAKNDFEWGLVMRFAYRAAYAAYDAHPEHVRFVEEVWIPGVASFQEIDFVAAK